MSQEGVPHAYERKELTYNRYLAIDELLQLQVLQSDPAEHDETLFIIIHQAYELWFKQVLHELDAALRALAARRLLRAYRSMDRVVKIFQLLVQQISILGTMAPSEFLQFRDRLNPASGFQSIQFREIEFVGGLGDPQYLNIFKNWPEYVARLQHRLNSHNLSTAYFKLLLEEGYEIPVSLTVPGGEPTEAEREAALQALHGLYQTPDNNLRLYLLSEALVEFDEQLLLWRMHHRLTVERIIGSRRGTGGSSGVKYLESTTSKRCFPLLWEVRTYLFKLPSDERPGCPFQTG